jgi:hypothetical protein
MIFTVVTIVFVSTPVDTTVRELGLAPDNLDKAPVIIHVKRIRYERDRILRL